MIYRHLRRLLFAPYSASDRSASLDASSHGSNPSSLQIDWVLPQVLAVGRLPAPGDGKSLSQAGVRVILSLCAETEGHWPDDILQLFQCYRIPMPDSHYLSPLQPEHIAAAVSLVDRQIRHRQPIFVHCLAGIERSPTICVAYLCRFHRLALWEALNWVKQVHPETSPSENQIRAIRAYLEKSDRSIA